MRRSPSFSGPRVVAALYVDVARGPYTRMLGVEPWGQTRDATKYEGPHPIVAHPFCGPWGRLAHLTMKQDPGHGPRAVEQVLRWGGVLEHPADSRLWKEMGLPTLSKTIPRVAPRVWALEVEQCRWGHEAEKRTWLLFVGIRPQDLLPIPPWREPCAVIDSSSRHKGQGLGKATGEARRTHVPKSRRHLTPPAFAEWLVAAARTARSEPGGRGARFQQVQQAPCTDVAKSQAVRALDVAVLGPGTIVAGVAAKGLPVLARGALVAYGAGTMGYNWRNWKATRRANRGRAASRIPPRLKGCWVVGDDAVAFDETAIYDLFRAVGVRIASYEDPLFACVNRQGDTWGAAVGGLQAGEIPEFRFSVAVAQEARRRGVASHLVGAIIDYWKGEQATWREAYGVEGVELVAWVINPAMGALLEAMGFEADYPGWSEGNPMMRYKRYNA